MQATKCWNFKTNIPSVAILIMTSITNYLKRLTAINNNNYKTAMVSRVKVCKHDVEMTLPWIYVGLHRQPNLLTTHF